MVNAYSTNQMDLRDRIPAFFGSIPARHTFLMGLDKGEILTSRRRSDGVKLPVLAFGSITMAARAAKTDGYHSSLLPKTYCNPIPDSRLLMSNPAMIITSQKRHRVAKRRQPRQINSDSDNYRPKERLQGLYVASLDALRKLHCLKEMCKMTFAGYGGKKSRKKTHGDLWWIHLKHCICMLARDTMCHADADVLMYNWRNTQKYPLADVSSNRECRDFDALLSGKEE